MNWKLNLMLAALAAAPLALAAPSLAQPAGGPPPHEEHMQRPDPAALAARHAQHLRDILQLRPDQEGAVSALIESMRSPEGMRRRMGDDPQDAAGLTTPQRLDRMLAHLDEQRAMMARHAEAMKRFYAQLSPSQQKAFDALQAGHGTGGHGMGGDGRPMMMQRMGHPGMDGPGHDGPGHDAPE